MDLVKIKAGGDFKDWVPMQSESCERKEGWVILTLCVESRVVSIKNY